MIKRRDFIKDCSYGCFFFLCIHNSPALQDTDEKTEKQKKIPDPEKCTYCGFNCTEACELLQATIKNDSKLKKKVYKEWKIKENHGIEFDETKIFCYGCKEENKPYSMIMKKCTVRKCAIDRKLLSCIQCKELKKCDKELWIKFPDFKKSVEKMQEEYVTATKKELM